MIEIAGKLFRLSSIDHVQHCGNDFMGDGRATTRILMRSGEWVIVKMPYDEVKALVIKAEAEALAYSALDAALGVR